MSAGHPLFARLYGALIVRGIERSGGNRLRRELLADLSGTVVEVGAGDGANFAHYPPPVTRVLAVEPDPYLRGRAERAAVADRIEVTDADAAHLPLPDGTADAVVFCLVLCSVPDVRAALTEARRVLRPDGQLRVLEHVLSPASARLRRVQRALDSTLWPRLFGGCHLSRDTVAEVEAAGFEIDELTRFSFPEGSRMPTAPAILGTARPR